jgi:hypothetical protein
VSVFSSPGLFSRNSTPEEIPISEPDKDYDQIEKQPGEQMKRSLEECDKRLSIREVIILLYSFPELT